MATAYYKMFCCKLLLSSLQEAVTDIGTVPCTMESTPHDGVQAALLSAGSTEMYSIGLTYIKGGAAPALLPIMTGGLPRNTHPWMQGWSTCTPPGQVHLHLTLAAVKCHVYNVI